MPWKKIGIFLLIGLGIWILKDPHAAADAVGGAWNTGDGALDSVFTFLGDL